MAFGHEERCAVEYLLVWAPVIIANRHRRYCGMATGAVPVGTAPVESAYEAVLPPSFSLMLKSPMSTHTVLWTILSMMASARTSAPSLACQSFLRCCVQKIVEPVPIASRKLV